VQLHRDFRFADATALAPYLSTLGLSHLYCSPYLRARPGSRHGYDIVDHTMLNPEIGTTADFDTMVDTLVRHGMSHLCDIVPNHMAVMGHDNAWWMDVLEHGPASTYAGFFDIDWNPQDPDLAGKLLVPVLGDPYGAVLERGELVLGFERETGTFAVRYHEHRLPLDPRDCAAIVELALAAVTERMPADAVAEAESIVSGLRLLPTRSEDAPERIAARRRDAPLCKRRLAQLTAAQALLAEAIDTIVQRFNGTAGAPQTFEPLDTLLEAQAFRLAF
jgi:(1->4)-alpha-D-glucan 1-alpha-D-glucosylmutase